MEQSVNSEEPLVFGKPCKAPKPRSKVGFLGQYLTPVVVLVVHLALTAAGYWFARLVPWAPRTTEGQIYVAALGAAFFIAIVIRFYDLVRPTRELVQFEFGSDSACDSIQVTFVEGEPSLEVPWSSVLSFDDREESKIALATRLEDPRLANMVVPTPGDPQDRLRRLLQARGVERSGARVFRVSSEEDSAA